MGSILGLKPSIKGRLNSVMIQSLVINNYTYSEDEGNSINNFKSFKIAMKVKIQ